MTDNWKEITDPEELFRLKREGWEVEEGWSHLYAERVRTMKIVEEPKE